MDLLGQDRSYHKQRNGLTTRSLSFDCKSFFSREIRINEASSSETVVRLSARSLLSFSWVSRLVLGYGARGIIADYWPSTHAKEIVVFELDSIGSSYENGVEKQRHWALKGFEYSPRDMSIHSHVNFKFDKRFLCAGELRIFILRPTKDVNGLCS